jgi:hypothetical protein
VRARTRNGRTAVGTCWYGCADVPWSILRSSSSRGRPLDRLPAWLERPRTHAAHGAWLVLDPSTIGNLLPSHRLLADPPQGWRSWNAFGNRITQTMMLDAAKTLVTKTKVPGHTQNVSLCDIGYCSVGVDEGWEGCGEGVNGTQHDASGLPTIDTASFPDTGGMVSDIHGLGLAAGWYLNGCKCGERTELLQNYEGDIKDLHAFGFDGVKM